MIRAVLWDIDGTLLDSEPHHFKSFVAVCESHGQTLAKADYDRLLGRSMAEVYALLNAVQPLPLDLPEFAAACSDHYVTHVADVPPRPGALEKVADLAGSGIAQACVSNSARRVVEANMAVIAMPEALGFALSRDDVTRGKPDPEPYLRAAERLGVPPDACVAVEDSPIGARAAKAAGMITIAWPQHRTLEFDAVDRIVGQLDEIDWTALLRDRKIT
ncbi:HAD family phosphatase [Skermanella rosea]|uniref:HAD family hydrolase n=1 Tax=Skermanella rosea TaxID=1817965 RepID=UPI001932F2CC|nr:HAD family phosphatase [Skermanella rosea]UEM02596.1 HAD family phosphatase [Skermanella rosea]